jgi:hypothetical protein
VSGLFHRVHWPWAWTCPCDVFSSIALTPFVGRRVLDSQAYSMLRVGRSAFAFDARARDSVARKVTVVLDFVVCANTLVLSRNSAHYQYRGWSKIRGLYISRLKTSG